MTPQVIDTHVTSNRQHVLVFFSDGTWQTYRLVTPTSRTWLARLRNVVRVWA